MEQGTKEPYDVIAFTKDGKTTVYASWNGATEVASWRVRGGNGDGALATVGEAPKDGFETAVEVPDGPTRFEVQALDAAGKVLGTSAPVEL